MTDLAFKEHPTRGARGLLGGEARGAAQGHTRWHNSRQARLHDKNRPADQSGWLRRRHEHQWNHSLATRAAVGILSVLDRQSGCEQRRPTADVVSLRKERPDPDTIHGKVVRQVESMGQVEFLNM